MNYVSKIINLYQQFIIVIHAKNNSIEKITEKCKEIYIEKLKVMTKLNRRLEKDTRIMELCQNEGDILRDLNTYVPNLMNRLWEQPKLVVSVIQHAQINDLKNHLAPFFANNFYENILSSYYIEDNLMYVLSLLIKSEIDSLTNINQNNKFLEETPCGIMLGELRRKSDIQAYFKNIIKNAIEDLEANNSTNKIDFDADKMVNFYEKLGSKKDKKDNEIYCKYPSSDQNSDSISLEDGINRDKKKAQKEQEQFNQKYIPNLDKKQLIKIIEENKEDKEKHDYLYPKLSTCGNEENIFTNERLLTFLNKYKHPERLLFIYQNHFMIVINFLDAIIKNITENFHLVPYSIKCLCRIISELITNKFPSISSPEKNIFIAKFFFGKLLIPILINPGVEAFVNNFISQNSLYNLRVIAQILKKYVSGNFYTNSDVEFNFTPFNWYFITNIKDIFTIFKEITKVRFPTFIENFVNNKLPPDYEYSYFNENPDEVVNLRSILYNIDQLSALIATMDSHTKEIFLDNKGIKIQKAMEKLKLPNNQELIRNIINSEKVVAKDPRNMKEKDKKKAKEKDKKKAEVVEDNQVKQHYFLITNLDSNDSYTKLLKIEPKTNFNLKELKEIKNEEEMNKNNIIRVKNFFFNLLYNYHKLVKTDFDEGTTENTEKILTELNIFMKSSNFVMDGSIPSEWYVKSLLEYLQKLPENLTKNDNEELYNDMERDINKSIKSLDFEALSVIMGKLKFANRSLMYYQQSLTLLEDIKYNEQIRKIMTEIIIPVDIKFYYEGSDSGHFSIDETKLKEKDLFNDDKRTKYEMTNKLKICLTIESFPKKFPNLVKYQEMQDADIFEIQEQLKFPEQIQKYIDLIKKYLKNYNVPNIEQMMDKIYDYIMGKIYDKIYPIEPSEEDNKIFQKSVLLSWTKPKHFLKAKKEFVFGSFEKDSLELFKLLDVEKSPRKKFVHLDGIFNSITFLLRFNGKGLDVGVDDQMPILNYAFIKAQALRMNSNVRFMELYIGDGKRKREGAQLTQFKGICEFIPKIKNTDLDGVSQQDFIKRCNEATKEIK